MSSKRAGCRIIHFQEKIGGSSDGSRAQGLDLRVISDLKMSNN